MKLKKTIQTSFATLVQIAFQVIKSLIFNFVFREREIFFKYKQFFRLNITTLNDLVSSILLFFLQTTKLLIYSFSELEFFFHQSFCLKSWFFLPFFSSVIRCLQIKKFVFIIFHFNSYLVVVLFSILYFFQKQA